MSKRNKTSKMADEERALLQEQIRAQGDVVRQMKADQKPQEEVNMQLASWPCGRGRSLGVNNVQPKNLARMR